MRTESPIRVLLVDDDEDDYLLTRDLLAEIPGGGYTLDWASSYDAGLAALRLGQHNVYLLDYRLGEHTGMELLRAAQQINCPGALILLTGQGELAVDREAALAGAADFLEKSRLDATILERSIRFALHQRRIELDLEKKVQERTADLQKINQALEKEIAERRRVEQALREEHHRKDVFLSTLAHELRNPLAPITNSLEIIRLAGNNPESMAGARAMMGRQLGHLTRLIDDLLDVARINQGKLTLHLGPLLLHDVIEAALEVSRPLFEKAGVILEVQLEEGPFTLDGDRARLVQVLTNLLNNASRYSQAGGKVILGVKQDKDHVVLRLRDHGIGISAEMLPRIFDLFTQANPHGQMVQHGLGIGLALVRQMVLLHNGTVEAHSEGEGKGSEFVVRLPLRKKAA
jgi:signal transduction histidine kinase